MVVVKLRPVLDSDIGAFYEHQLDPDAARMAAFPSREREAHAAHWQRILTDEQVVALTVTVGGETAGNVVSWIEDGRREIGYWIGKSYWGRGVATEAVGQFVGILPDRPLVAWVARHNLGSIKVLERCGFTLDGEHEDHLIFRLESGQAQDARGPR